MKIPNLAIHLTDKSGTFEPNKESHLKPVVSSTSLGIPEGQGPHLESLLNRIAVDLSLKGETIVDLELNIVDSQPAQLVGMNREFVSGPRIDNLGSSLIALEALVGA